MELLLGSCRHLKSVMADEFIRDIVMVMTKELIVVDDRRCCRGRNMSSVKMFCRAVACICCLCGFLIAVCAVMGVTTRIGSNVDSLSVFEKRGEICAGQDSAVPVPVRPEAAAYSSVPTLDVARMDGRPPRVRNLLLRLEDAEKARDVEMAILTIEELRSLPGSPVWDLEDRLVRRLGELNLALLFKMKCPRWVSLVTVKHGDTASSIASEYGTTLASLDRLNDSALDNIKAGQSIYTLDHPCFKLVTHLRTRTSDLYLNGKLFKRYDLKSVSGLKMGSCEWGEISLSVTDRKELEMLLPRNTSMHVLEM